MKAFRHKKGWDSAPDFIAEGFRILNEIIESNFKIKAIYTTNQLNIKNIELAKLVKIVDTNLLNQISLQTAPQGILFLIEKKHYELPKTLNNQWALYLDGIQDPGNVGAIIRIADWFGIDYVFLSEQCAQFYNPKTIQSTMGSFLRIKTITTSLANLKNNYYPNTPIYGAYLEGENILETQFQLPPGILVIGNEGHGISTHNTNFIQRRLTIKKHGQADSLNAAISLGIILSHCILPIHE